MNWKTALIGLYIFLSRSTARIILERRIKGSRHLFDSKTVLEIGGGINSNKQYRTKAKRYITLDKSPAQKADYTACALNMPFQNGTFEVVFCTEVMEHIRDFQKLEHEIHRILKDGGICLLSTRFLYKIHCGDEDYFRFTAESLRHIFKNFREIKINPMGNRFTVFWDLLWPLSFPAALINALSPLVRAVFFWDDKDAPSGYFLTAKK